MSDTILSPPRIATEAFTDAAAAVDRLAETQRQLPAHRF
jgi:hypothetical protein